MQSRHGALVTILSAPNVVLAVLHHKGTDDGRKHEGRITHSKGNRPTRTRDVEQVPHAEQEGYRSGDDSSETETIDDRMSWRHGYLQAFEFERRSDVGERPDTTIDNTADAKPRDG